MRKTLVAGNWKMNGSRSSIEELMAGVIGGAAAANADMLVCPPYVYLEQVRAAVAGTSVKLGAQDVSLEVSGAFTGDVSAVMLKDLGCDYVIVGHS